MQRACSFLTCVLSEKRIEDYLQIPVLFRLVI